MTIGTYVEPEVTECIRILKSSKYKNSKDMYSYMSGVDIINLNNEYIEFISSVKAKGVRVDEYSGVRLFQIITELVSLPPPLSVDNRSKLHNELMLDLIYNECSENIHSEYLDYTDDELAIVSTVVLDVISSSHLLEIITPSVNTEYLPIKWIWGSGICILHLGVVKCY